MIRLMCCIILMERAMGKFTDKARWLEIACQAASFRPSPPRWADPKTRSGRVQCCSDDGKCKRKNAQDECYSKHDVKFYVAKRICESDGRRLCTKEETLSEVCCDRGCQTNPKLVWTSNHNSTVATETEEDELIGTTTIPAKAKGASSAPVICQKDEDCPGDESCIGSFQDNSSTQYHTCELVDCEATVNSENFTTSSKWELAVQDYCCSQGLIAPTLCKGRELIGNADSNAAPTTDGNTISNAAPTPDATTSISPKYSTLKTAESTTSGANAPLSTVDAATPTFATLITSSAKLPTMQTKITTTIVSKRTTIQLCKFVGKCPHRQVCIDYTVESGEQRQACELKPCLDLSRVIDRADLSQWTPAVQKYCCRYAIAKHIGCTVVDKTTPASQAITTTTSTAINETGITIPLEQLLAARAAGKKKVDSNSLVVACVAIGVTACGIVTVVYVFCFLAYVSLIKKKKKKHAQSKEKAGDKDGNETKETHESTAHTSVQLHFDQPYQYS